ncbi:2-dehydropantoate 2-reductase [Streptomyces chiangmaiensis]|uniref:2-dehydropantoate 2-reductase n=1 Tax=Streptomyces chiangmaiensis TaxID=766497 RepID=A0ABU7FVV4_9ACTN|nr:2-dehydropantoate 2-reductase [Streptomyces chiangmaiensis]MED7828179.1 2-dehydropantoate 2-reductase [Streptomyces chiangmaiensis]
MRIAVVGAGGVGGYFGARLAAGGHEVTFVARGRHLEAIRDRGLLVRSPLGDLKVPATSVVATIAELGPADVVLVAVKLWDTEDVAAQLRDVVNEGTRVISLQNGVRKDAVLRRYLPAQNVWGGVCYISAVIEEPGVVAHRGAMQKVVFGPYDDADTQRAGGFLEACVSSGIEAELSSDIERVIWEKFVFLVGLSATTSAVRQPVGVIRSDARARELLHDVMAEAVNVGRAAGVRLDPDFADERLAFYDTLPPAMTSSMHHDLMQGNRLELPWLSGSVVDLGRELGIPTPRNQTIADVLAPYELGRPDPDR